MDVAVWSNLRPADQKLIGTLIYILPEFLEAVLGKPNTSARPEHEWVKLISDVKDIFLDCTSQEKLAI
jgi:exonuclease V gamma subunit